LALLIGLFFACFVAALVLLPFLLLVMRIGEKRPVVSLILMGIGIYIAIQVFKSVMGSFLDGLSP